MAKLQQQKNSNDNNVNIDEVKNLIENKKNEIINEEEKLKEKLIAENNNKENENNMKNKIIIKEKKENENKKEKNKNKKKKEK